MCLVGNNFIPLLNITLFPVVRFDDRPKKETAYAVGNCKLKKDNETVYSKIKCIIFVCLKVSVIFYCFLFCCLFVCLFAFLFVVVFCCCTFMNDIRFNSKSMYYHYNNVIKY